MYMKGCNCYTKVNMETHKMTVNSSTCHGATTMANMWQPWLNQNIAFIELSKLMWRLCTERSLAGQTLVDDRSNAPQVSFGIIRLRHDHFRSLTALNHRLWINTQQSLLTNHMTAEDVATKCYQKWAITKWQLIQTYFLATNNKANLYLFM